MFDNLATNWYSQAMKNYTRIQAFTDTGLSIPEIARASGYPYTTVWRHAVGQRTISPEAVIVYESKLGIPRYKLRPDLWPAPQEVSNAQETTQND